MKHNRLPRYALYVGLAAVVLISMAFGLNRLMRLRVRTVELSGTVVYADSGLRVPQAHVIVELWDVGIKSYSTCYGVVADDQGNFKISYRSPKLLRRQLSILASAPNDDYGVLGTKDILKNGGQIEAIDILVQVGPLAGGPEKKSYEYDHFCPGCQPRGTVVFLDGKWDATAD